MSGIGGKSEGRGVKWKSGSGGRSLPLSMVEKFNMLSLLILQLSLAETARAGCISVEAQEMPSPGTMFS